MAVQTLRKRIAREILDAHSSHRWGILPIFLFFKTPHCMTNFDGIATVNTVLLFLIYYYSLFTGNKL
jgi:hypothetical protein